MGVLLQIACTPPLLEKGKSKRFTKYDNENTNYILAYCGSHEKERNDYCKPQFSKRKRNRISCQLRGLYFDDQISVDNLFILYCELSIESFEA